MQWKDISRNRIGISFVKRRSKIGNIFQISEIRIWRKFKRKITLTRITTKRKGSPKMTKMRKSLSKQLVDKKN